MTVCEIAAGRGSCTPVPRAEAFDAAKWAEELLARHHVPQKAIDLVADHLRGALVLDLQKLGAAADASGLIKDVFRAAIIGKQRWALALLWEHGVSFVTAQDMLEDGELDAG